MEEIVELTLAGQMASGPMGGTISLPYLPWTPTEITNLAEEDRERVLEIIRNLRERVLQK